MDRLEQDPVGIAMDDAGQRAVGRIARRIAGLRRLRPQLVRIGEELAGDRIGPELVAALRPDGVASWLVVHANHPRELTAAVVAALGRLVDGGIPVLSQSVLLRGVNDDPEVLGALLRRLVEARVKPYYLHHLDHAAGTARFRTSIAEGQAIMRALRGRYSGLCQPSYVLDVPGGHGKVPIGPGYLETDADGTLVRDPDGAPHRYPPRP